MKTEQKNALKMEYLFRIDVAAAATLSLLLSCFLAATEAASKYCKIFGN